MVSHHVTDLIGNKLRDEKKKLDENVLLTSVNGTEK